MKLKNKYDQIFEGISEERKVVEDEIVYFGNYSRETLSKSEIDQLSIFVSNIFLKAMKGSGGKLKIEFSNCIQKKNVSSIQVTFNEVLKSFGKMVLFCKKYKPIIDIQFNDSKIKMTVKTSGIVKENLNVSRIHDSLLQEKKNFSQLSKAKVKTNIKFFEEDHEMVFYVESTLIESLKTNSVKKKAPLSKGRAYYEKNV